MNYKKPILLATLLGALSVTSGCEVIQPQVDTIDGAVAVPVGPPSPSQPRDEGRGGGRGGGGGGGWG